HRPRTSPTARSGGRGRRGRSTSSGHLREQVYLLCLRLHCRGSGTPTIPRHHLHCEDVPLVVTPRRQAGERGAVDVLRGAIHSALLPRLRVANWALHLERRVAGPLLVAVAAAYCLTRHRSHPSRKAGG